MYIDPAVARLAPPLPIEDVVLAATVGAADVPPIVIVSVLPDVTLVTTPVTLTLTSPTPLAGESEILSPAIKEVTPGSSVQFIVTSPVPAVGLIDISVPAIIF